MNLQRRRVSRARANAGSAHTTNKSGFTIVELVVAVMILTVGVLGLAGTSAVILNQMTRGNAQTVGSQIAASRFENLSGRKCATSAFSGSATSRGVTESWKVTIGDNSTLVAELAVTIPGRRSTEKFSTVISCFP